MISNIKPHTVCPVRRLVSTAWALPEIGHVLRILCLMAAFGVGAVFPACAVQYMTPEKAIERAFSEATSVEQKRALATREQRQQIERLAGRDRVSPFFTYHEARSGQRLLGYAVIGDVLGKHKPITYLIAFSPQHSVSAVEILEYRENYGDEIRFESFRSQLVGREPGKPLRLHEEIRNISGATISCRSLIRAVTENLAYVSVLLPKESPERKSASPDKDTDDAAATHAPERTKAQAVSDRPSPANEETVFRRRARMQMGTTLDIQTYAHSDHAADAALEAAFAEVARIESLLSTYRSDSIVSQLNRQTAQTTTEVGPEVAALLERSRELSQRTGNRFDVTIGPLVRLWRDSERRQEPPNGRDLKNALDRVGMDGIRTTVDNRVQMLKQGMEIDFGAVGKGYALDRAAAVLREQGIHRALLNFGGQLLAMDAPTGAPAWNVQIRDPRDENRMIAQINIVREAVATSGDDQRGLLIHGQRYSHIVNPTTGWPVQGLISATVITPAAESADAWATALFGAGTDDGLKMARAQNLDILLMNPNGELLRTGSRFTGTNNRHEPL